jgi:hypothetical protein
MTWIFHILAAIATGAHLLLGGLLFALLLTASAPESPLVAVLLKAVGLILFMGFAGACAWLWARRNWAILFVPLAGVASEVAITYAGNNLLSWTIQFGPAP